MIFKNIGFQKHNWTFELSHFFKIIFRSICCSVSPDTGHHPFPVNYKLINITIVASNICFSALLLLFLRDFIKFSRIFFIFVRFIGFLFSLEIITIIVGPIRFEFLGNWEMDIDIFQLLPMKIKMNVLGTSVKLIVFEIRNVFLNFPPHCSFYRPVNQSHWGQVSNFFYWCID